MNALLQRWRALAPREQWLGYLVGLALVVALYLLLIGDPLAARQARLVSQAKAADARLQVATAELQALAARQAADPNLQYRTALQVAHGEREDLIGRIDSETAGLVPPEAMRGLLQDLLKDQPQLRLLGLQSFSAPLQLPTAEAEKSEEAAPVVLYRHGLRLTLEGGYFDLLDYLKAIEGSDWKLHWERLDYQVGEAGYGQARIVLELYTLSREAGWVGV